MTVARRLTVGAVGLLALGFLVGCQDPKDLQIQSLQEQRDKLQRENDDLRRRLAAVTQERDEARARVLDLQNRIRELEGAGEAKKVGDFTPFGPYDYAEISEEILFDSGKAELKTSGRAKLQDIVRQINERFADKDILVIGHTDNDPIRLTKDKWVDNLDLSVNRGATVVREMIRLSLRGAKLVAAGQGEFNPRAPNNTRAEKQLNRRVQIIAAPKLPVGGEKETQPAVKPAKPAAPPPANPGTPGTPE